MDEPTSANEVFDNLDFGRTPDPDVRSGTAEESEAAAPTPETEPVGGETDSECSPPAKGEPAQNPSHPPVPALADEIQSTLRELQAGIDQLAREVKAIAESSSKTAVEVRDVHRLYHNEFASRLVSMQEELEHYREVDKGRIFDDILTEIAKLYTDNESLVDEVTDEKPKKRLRYMFMDLLQILEINGVFLLKSKPGDKRNTRHCQVNERVPTDDPSLHDTVVKSHNVGFYIENRSLVKELIDVYLFTDTATHHLDEN